MTTLTLSRPRLTMQTVTTTLLVAAFALSLFTIGRGIVSGDFGRIFRMPPTVAMHVFTVIPAMPLTIFLLNSRPGSRMHRIAGYVWSTLMVMTAIAGFLIAPLGTFNPIQIFSVATLAGVPRAIYLARQHRIAEHQTVINSLVYGGLILAGGFAFLPGRLMLHWISG